ncbi:hypothetical protein EHF33_04930 [Deinococcus psychrotolerans]|uniref:Uncharacterized protein n=1 Tax=Deinococcus psychrotolerans TaxID=2489213 RepID=A0A3G8YKT6_9DEIO|nr:hypothetical protein [Deinococcus psychrotolerans]AZI42171.1 hypothetical protein EHF33_04930 [Deinococcus psychrotolerans]
MLTFTENSPNGSCCTSDAPTEQLVKGFQALLEPLAFSPGWRKDYETWADLYQFNGVPEITFGVGITPVKGNQDLEGIASIKKFTNFINITVNQPK